MNIENKNINIYTSNAKLLKVGNYFLVWGKMKRPMKVTEKPKNIEL